MFKYLSVFALLLPAFSTSAIANTKTSTRASYPTIEVLETFEKTCTKIDDLKISHKRALAMGWVDDIPPTGTELNHRIKLMHENEGKGVIRVLFDTVLVMSKTIEGRKLWLLLTDKRLPDSEKLLRMRSCNIFDLNYVNQQQSIDINIIKKYFKKTPHINEERAAFAIIYWGSDIIKGTTHSTISYERTRDNLTSSQSLAGALTFSAEIADWVDGRHAF